jgi:hypothetical protein
MKRFSLFAIITALSIGVIVGGKFGIKFYQNK